MPVGIFLVVHQKRLLTVCDTNIYAIKDPQLFKADINSSEQTCRPICIFKYKRTQKTGFFLTRLLCFHRKVWETGTELALLLLHSRCLPPNFMSLKHGHQTNCVTRKPVLYYLKPALTRGLAVCMRLIRAPGLPQRNVGSSYHIKLAHKLVKLYSH